MTESRRQFFLGSDLGTSGCKSVVLDDQGREHGWALASYATHRPYPGWAEQDPQDWYQAFCQTCRAALSQARIDPVEIAMVCIVGITHNAVLLDAHEQVLRPSILYTDTRSVAQARALLEAWGDQVIRRTHNQLSPIWTWPQLQWVREHEPKIWERIQRILFPKDYVRNRLAPSFLSDTIDPVGTLLYDPEQRSWIEPFCQALGLGQEAFPQPVSPMQVVGSVSQASAQECGLRAGTPVIAGTTDTAAEVFGTGALRPGQAIVKLATVGRIAAVAEGPLPDAAILNYPHILDGLWYPGTATKFGASAFAWARSAFWDEDDLNCNYEQLDTLAATAPVGSDGLIFHPYLDGEFAPSWDPRLQASFLGINLHHRRPHFTRAVMEGVAYAIREALESVMAMGLTIDEIRLIGGGAASELWSTIMSDVLQRSVLLPVGTDAAFGAALLAGVGSGALDSNPQAIDEVIRFHKRLEPNPESVALYDELYSVYQDAARSLETISHRLHAFRSESHARLCKENAQGDDRRPLEVTNADQ